MPTAPSARGPLTAYLLQVLANLLGGGSLVVFALFLFAGPFALVDLSLSSPEALAWNLALCLAFFVQHSAMIRTPFRRRLQGVVSTHYHGAVYSIASGAVLLALVLAWQSVGTPLVSAQGAARWAARAVYVAGIAGFVWGVLSLHSFDAFGAGTIRAHLKGKPPRSTRFVVRGPYRWVRHPLYLFSLLLIWSSPDVTTDRLLFNACFTVWIFVGSWLEERDLVEELGDAYRAYQRDVPMLIPWRLRPVPESAPRDDHGDTLAP
jgi:protein-S-isoprenylcysteine O-methyltransferase Ste14